MKVKDYLPGHIIDQGEQFWRVLLWYFAAATEDLANLSAVSREHNFDVELIKSCELDYGSAQRLIPAYMKMKLA